MSERDEVAAAYAKRDYLLSNYVEEEGPIDGSPCWIWQGYCRRYGVIGFDGFNYQVHRLAWVNVNGPVPNGLEVRHACDNPACIRLDHLELGTHAQNMQDMWDRRRAVIFVGSQCSNTSLTETDVVQIRHLIAEGKSYRLVARMFGITSNAVHLIAIGRSWGHAAGPRQKQQERTKLSQFKGVSPYHRDERRWRAYGDEDGRRIYLGLFGFEVDAAIAVNYHDAYHGKPIRNAIPADEMYHD
jgi:predicted GNAT family N-acyltransferase